MHKHPVSRKRDLWRGEGVQLCAVIVQPVSPQMYIVSVPEDTILRVAIERGKMRDHPPAEPNYITRGNGHIV